MNQSTEQFVLRKDQSWQMFDQISGKYDFLNRVLSLGQDLAWRKRLARHIPRSSTVKLLDVATGTADVAISLVRECTNIDQVVGVDMSKEMLNVGRIKLTEMGLNQQIELKHADAQKLPLDDCSFEAATISFGIRNVPALNKGLMEMYRVLKPGGRVLILEFSMPKNPLLRAGHVFYLRTVVPVVGFLFSGHYKAYKYLNQTIEDFPYGEQFCNILNQVGFKNIKMDPLMGGVATIYIGEK